ncbi:MAG: hypothetical protein AB1505_34580 [Candidatus Latescibacterota bacterium]
MPTLARLTLRIHPDSAEVPERTFGRAVAPLLARHGLAAPTPCPRPPIPGLWSRLYQVDDPGRVRQVHQTQQADADWQAAVASPAY